VVLLVGASLLSAGAARSQEFECLVEPHLDVEVSSGVPGILDEVLVDRGDAVENGQVLARLRSDVERASYELAKARVQFAERKLNRNEEMYRRQMISIHEKDEIETELNLLRLELREVEARLQLRTIESPLTGVVVDRYFSPGEYVQEDPIVRLAQVDPLRVEVAVPASMYGRIRVGMEAAVTWERPVTGTHDARVTVVDPVVDAASGTIGIRLELPNPENRLPAGARCTVRFPVAED
jgi:RND family efflux transporter MFP subunit